MWFNLIAVLVLGVAVAGVTMLAFRAFGRKPPRWILPIAAGVAMMTYTLYNDYSWFSRTAGALPPSVRVAQSYGQPSPLQPWTYLVAPVNRFVAVGRVVPNPEQPDYRLAEIFVLQRYMPTATVSTLFDCAGGRRADAVDIEGFDEAGEPIGGPWRPLDADDPLRAVVCDGGEAATS